MPLYDKVVAGAEQPDRAVLAAWGILSSLFAVLACRVTASVALRTRSGECGTTSLTKLQLLDGRTVQTKIIT
eukprot:6468586-Amphidinium_carterae.1